MTYKPSWFRFAEQFIGITEVPGPASNPRIVEWLVKLKAPFRDDATPWCGAFVGYCLQNYGVNIPASWAWAKSWATWGVERSRTNCGPGTVLVFTREGGGHVGFYVGEDATHFHVLGGNQSDAVNVRRFPKARCIAARWPAGVKFTGKPVPLNPNGTAVSVREA